MIYPSGLGGLGGWYGWYSLVRGENHQRLDNEATNLYLGLGE